MSSWVRMGEIIERRLCILYSHESVEPEKARDPLGWATDKQDETV